MRVASIKRLTEDGYTPAQIIAEFPQLTVADIKAALDYSPPRPPTSVKSIRMSDELWAYVAERAARRGIKPNAWVVRMVGMLREGLLAEKRPTPSPSPPAPTSLSPGRDR